MVGGIEIELLISVQVFLVTLQVMEIYLSYMLLGRLWIHTINVVTSSFHQCLKYIMNETMMTVKAEEILVMMQNVVIPYTEAKWSKDRNLHAFEIVNAK